MNFWTAVWRTTTGTNTNDPSNQSTGGTPLVPQPAGVIVAPGLLEPARIMVPEQARAIVQLEEKIEFFAKKIAVLQEQLSVIYLRCVFCGEERELGNSFHETGPGLVCGSCSAAVRYARKLMFEDAKETFMEISDEIRDLPKPKITHVTDA